MKKFSTVLAIAFGIFATAGTAADIQGFASGYAPGKVKVKEKLDGEEIKTDLDHDLVWGLGAEFLANPVGPLMVGGGIGFLSQQKDGDADIVAPVIPLFGSIGVIGPEKWPVRPYLGARVGYPIPAATNETWFNKPLHFFATGNVGVRLPYHVGLEFDCTYLTMYKEFKKTDLNFRTTSIMFGGSITVHFSLGGSSKAEEKPEEKPAEQPADTAAAPAEENPYDATPAEEPANTDSTATDASVNPWDQPAEQPADSAAAEPAAAEPAAEEPAADSAAAPEGETAAEPEQAAEEAEQPAEESAEAAEEPAEEPAVEEPAPEPEKKPAAKKKAAKKSKAKAKKASKKSKKAAKKSKGKKKK